MSGTAIVWGSKLDNGGVPTESTACISEQITGRTSNENFDIVWQGSLLEREVKL